MNTGAEKLLFLHDREKIIATARSVCTIKYSKCLYIHLDLQLNIRKSV